MMIGRRMLRVGWGLLLGAVALSLTATLIYRAAFSDKIYPGVAVRGIDLGGLTVAEATARLQASALPLDPPPLAVRAADRSWLLGWEQTGRRYDLDAAAAMAYRVGREGHTLVQGWTTWRTLVQGTTVELPVTPPDEARLWATVEVLAEQLWVPATDARLEVGPGGVLPVAGQAGRAVDGPASMDALLAALNNGATSVELVLVAVPPRVTEPEPAATLAQQLLSLPFVLVANDPLTDYQAEFTAPPERVASWLRPVPAGQGIALEFNATPVQDWLAEVNGQLGISRTLDLGAAWAMTLAALATGQHQVQPRIYHPSQVYVVQPGDVFFDLAYRFGFPQWRLEEANPDVDPGAIDVGQVLTIPSIDVLFPHPIPPGKRIEIDLPTQTLRAYENEQLIFEFKVSSGMSTTPTIAGQFQVLMKEPAAFARRWQLDMPYFMGIYLEGPDYYNGIHELPITASGRRLPAGILGWPASFGCIIVNQGDAEALFNWAPLGTLVRIHGVAPGTPTGATTLDVVVSQEGGTPP